MPELPELEVIRDVLNARVVGQTITAVELIPPGSGIVVRDMTFAGFAEGVQHRQLTAVVRRGQFLLFRLERAATVPLWLLLNPKLTGRLQLATPGTKARQKAHVIFTLSGGGQLRYLDLRQMGQLYLTDDPTRLVEFDTLGPEPFDLTLDQFRARLKPLRGEIKGILLRNDFIAGIGNAYADEILWAARLHPYRKRNTLTAAEIAQLYEAMQTTLRTAIEQVRAEMGENIHQEPRSFMNVHLKAGQPCPRCGNPIAQVSANQRITNFCRTCQPGGLIKGM